jgi:hypothetical protein
VIATTYGSFYAGRAGEASEGFKRLQRDFAPVLVRRRVFLKPPFTFPVGFSTAASLTHGVHWSGGLGRRGKWEFRQFLLYKEKSEAIS